MSTLCHRFIACRDASPVSAQDGHLHTSLCVCASPPHAPCLCFPVCLQPCFPCAPSLTNSQSE